MGALPFRIRTAEEAHAEALARDPLRDFFTWWDDLTASDIRSFKSALTKARTEPEMQAYLQRHPKMLIQHLGGGHGRWVIPQPRLGSQHVPDFVIGDADSSGRHWVAVELEGPQRPLFNRSGDPSRYLWHAIRQIVDWRVWLDMNRDYATRPPEQGGLGLEDINSSVPGLIVIGRRSQLDTGRKAFRRALGSQLNIEIHTYDWLLERAAGRRESLRSRA